MRVSYGLLINVGLDQARLLLLLRDFQGARVRDGDPEACLGRPHVQQQQSQQGQERQQQHHGACQVLREDGRSSQDGKQTDKRAKQQLPSWQQEGKFLHQRQQDHDDEEEVSFCIEG